MNSDSPNSLTKKTFNGSAWVLAGNIVKAIAQLVPIAILARLISPAEFGVMTGALIIISIFEQIAYGGLGPTIVQMKVLRKDHIGSAYILSFTLSSAIALIIIALSSQIESLLGLPSLSTVIPWIALSFPISSLGIISARLLQRNLDIKFQTVTDTASYVVAYYLIGIPLAYYDFGIWALVIAFLSQVSIRSTALFLRTIKSFTLQTSRSGVKDLCGSGIAVMAGGIFVELLNNTDRISVGHALGTSALGVYGRASDLTQRCNRILDQVILRAFFPAFASKQSDHGRLKSALLHANSLCVIVTAPIALYLSTFSSEIIELVFGVNFLDASLPFKFLALTIIFTIISRTHMMLHHGTGNFWRSSLLQLIMFFAATAATLTAVKHGVTIVAITYLAIQIVRSIASNCMSLIILSASWRDSLKSYATSIPFIIICLISAEVSHALSKAASLNTTITLITGGVLFGAGCTVLSLIKPSILVGPSLGWLCNQLNLQQKSPFIAKLLSR